MMSWWTFYGLYIHTKKNELFNFLTSLRQTLCHGLVSEGQESLLIHFKSSLNSLFFFPFSAEFLNPLSLQEEENNKLWNRCSSISPNGIHCRKRKEIERKRKKEDQWQKSSPFLRLWQKNVIIRVAHSYANSLTIPMKKMVEITYKLF